MKTETLQMNIAEKALVKLVGFVWRVLRLLDPQHVQRYFAAKVNVQGATINKLHSVSTQDAICLLYTSPSPRDVEESRMPSSA